MTSTASLEGVKKAIFFPFQGKGWGMKWLIGSALNLANYIVPLVPLVPVYGYGGQIAKRIIQNDEDPALPEWTDWGLLFSDGIKLFGVSIIFTLPGGLSLFLAWLLMFAMNFTFLLDPRLYSNSSSNVVPGIFAGSMVGMIGGILLIFLGMLLLVIGGLFLPPALGHMIAKGEFGAAFRLKEWWPIFKSNLSGYVLALMINYGVNMIMMLAVYVLYFTVVLCFLMPFALMVAAFLMNMITYSLIGVVYRDSVRKLAEAK